jgi:hypothetical protein
MVLEEINSHVEGNLIRAIRGENCRISTWYRKKPKKPVNKEDVGKENEEVKVVV